MISERDTTVSMNIVDDGLYKRIIPLRKAHTNNTKNATQRKPRIVVVCKVISLVILLSSVAYLLNTANLNGYNKEPLAAVNLIFSLVSTSISCYQIVISLLLFWQTLGVKSGIFFCSLWYVSHLSILVVYFALFGARAVVCFIESRYIPAVVTIFVGIIYQAVFIYFCRIINSYMNTINEVRYY